MSRRLSVILTVFNGMPYLPETIESILAQTFKDFTFLIVDDGSTDGTAAYLQSLKDERIVLIRQANAGQGAARNVALSRCQTEFAAMTDADDVSHPDRLLLQVEYLDAHPDVVMVGTQIQFIVGGATQKAFRAPTEHKEIERRFLQGQGGMCQSSLMMCVNSARASGLYPDRAVGEDIEFCLRMCEQGRAANIDQVLVSYRIHSSATCVTRAKELIRAAHLSARRAICRRSGLPEPSMDVFLRTVSSIDRLRWSIEGCLLVQYRMGRVAIAAGRQIEGISRLALAALCKPFSAALRAASLFLHNDRIKTGCAV